MGEATVPHNRMRTGKRITAKASRTKDEEITHIGISSNKKETIPAYCMPLTMSDDYWLAHTGTSA
jgi:hypothetical protein